MIKINGELFGNEEFHNGEAIFKEVNLNSDNNIIEMVFKDNRDVANLIFARHYIFDKEPESKVSLIMLYCPYSRMDREINNQLFSMKYFADILSTLELDSVVVLDPHSKVCVDLLKEHGLNVIEACLKSYILKVIDDFQPDYICYPDKGAYNKYPDLLSGINIPYFYAEKTRDLSNKGKIIGYELVDAPDLKDKKVLIIDDICCLGGTAYRAAREIKLAGGSKVAFYISHCENGIFAGKLLKKEPFDPFCKEANLPWRDSYTIDKIYTANTMLLDKEHENIITV